MKETIKAAWAYLNALDTSAWVKRWVEAVFKQDGPVWVGMFSLVVLYLAVREAAAAQWKAPLWLVSTTGLFVIVLVTYAGYKGYRYTADSLWNSEKGKPAQGVTAIADQVGDPVTTEQPPKGKE